MIRTLEFRTASLAIHEHDIITTFREDGSQSRMWPPIGEAWYQAIARNLGYTDPLQYAREHEITHHWLADEMGWPHSWSLWSAAHGAWDSSKPARPWSQRVKDEEHTVNSLQRYINTGEVDAYGCLQAQWGDELPEAAGRLVALMRPWCRLSPCSMVGA
ncbi:hypothetical protein [Methylobacterium oryzisoli]|uniref:hypothetical protein n=1 Tax=Methylobacterium oryzisoli TaxID=3385502 RepID=UPI0038924BD3